MAIGLYKIKNGWANQDSVCVRYDDGKELELPGSKYVEQGYNPRISKLLWDVDFKGAPNVKNP